jgi:hypothetical protein
MRRFLALLALTLPLFFAGAFAPLPDVHAEDEWPAVLNLPDGWLPEGIVIGDGNILYSGSRRHGGIYAIDLTTGAGRILYEGRTGGAATGLKYDSRTGYIFASGAATGELNIIDSTTGNRVMSYKLAQTPGATFINDVIITPRAAYATDSPRTVIYKIPLGADGELSTQDDVQIIPLSGDYVHGTGNNLNGITATPNGDRLIGVQSNTGKLHLIDPNTGVTRLIEVNGPVVGDGLLLVDNILYASRNTAGNPALIKIDMAKNYLSGNILAEMRHASFDSPTTVALADNNRIYIVNSRFGAGMAPTVTYTVVYRDHIPAPAY